MAGVAAAVTNNSYGVAGLAFGARVVPIRVLGRCGGYVSDIADAIVWASGVVVPGTPANTYPAKVINLSLGGAFACDVTLQTAVTAARANGSFVVAIAGNSTPGANLVWAPGNCAGVFTVAGTDNFGGRLSISNYGSLVSIAAPGGPFSVLSNAGVTTPSVDAIDIKQGTSFAAPQVAGAAALALARNPHLDPDGLEWLLRATARPFPAACPGCGTGILDASAVAARAVQPLPFTLRLLSNDGVGLWEIKNVASLPLTLISFDLLLQSSNAWGSAWSNDCSTGSAIPAGGVCVFSTVAARCGSGEVYRVAAANSAGVTQSRESLPVADESCGA